MHLHRKPKASTPARWREACVDGVLHVAYAAAVGAESAAHRCANRLSRTRGRARRGRRDGARRH